MLLLISYLVHKVVSIQVRPQIFDRFSEIGQLVTDHTEKPVGFTHLVGVPAH